MPRVLIAGFTALPGPHRVGVQLRHVMRSLIRHHKVDVLVLRRGEQAYVERTGNARILRVPVPDGEIVGRVEAFRRALRRQLEGADYDIVHFSDGWAGKTVLELQPQLKYATVYDAGRSPLTGPLPLDVSVVSELQRTEAECAAQADLVLAPTEPARQFLSGTSDSKRVHLVAPGVDVDLFDWDLPPTDGRPLILYIGTLSQGRGIQLLLGAMLELVRDGVDAELILAGRAGREFRQNLATTLRDLGLESRVTFTGVLEHARVPELIARSTVCVAPAAPDIKGNRLALYPTKILEYLACQRAVIAPNRSSVSLLLRDGQTGLLFEPGQPSDLAATLKRALSDHALRARVARAGYDLVRRAHSASSTRRELSAAYSWLGSISPWRERFVASNNEVSDADVRMPGPEDTEAAGWSRRADEKVPVYDSDEMELSPGTGSGSVETLGDPVGEVTRVEVSPLLDDRDTRSTSLYPIDQDKADEWIVEDANTRPVQKSGTVGETQQTPRPAKSGVLTSMDASFVAGELNVSSGDTAEIAMDDGEFSAAGALLGRAAEEEKTRLFALPLEMRREPRAQRVQDTEPAPVPSVVTLPQVAPPQPAAQAAQSQGVPSPVSRGSSPPGSGSVPAPGRKPQGNRTAPPPPRSARAPNPPGRPPPTPSSPPPPPSQDEKTQIADFRPVQSGRPLATRASMPQPGSGRRKSKQRESASRPPPPPRTAPGGAANPTPPVARQAPPATPSAPPKPPSTPSGARPPARPSRMPPSESVILRDDDPSGGTQPFPRVSTPPDGSPK